jgi:signal transduction histidine kinase
LLPGTVAYLQWAGHRHIQVNRADDMPWADTQVAEAEQPAAILQQMPPQDRLRVLRLFSKSRRSGTDIRCRFRTKNGDAGPRDFEIVAIHDGTQVDTTAWWCWLHAVGSDGAGDWGNFRASGVATLLSKITHELRTPLNGVLGLTKMLRAGRASHAADGERFLATIELAAEHLAAVIQDISDLPSIQSGAVMLQITPVRLCAAVSEACSIVEIDAARANIAMVVKRDSDDLTVMADPVRLRQVMINLLTNAIKYNRPGNQIVVSWHSNSEIGTGSISVQDHGFGLRPDQMNRLFEPFNRLGAERTSVPGVGLGLVIAQSLVQKMRGSINVESCVDVGTKFTLNLPLVRQLGRSSNSAHMLAATQG